MATIHKWTTTTGDFSAAASFSSAVAPTAWATDDVCLFDGTSQHNVTTGLDTVWNNTIDRFIVTPDYKGTIGASGSPLHVYADVMTLRGAKSGYYNSSVATKVLVDVMNPQAVQSLDGAYIMVLVKAGIAHLAATATINANGVVATVGTDADLTLLGSTATLPKTTVCDAGILRNYRIGPETITNVWVVSGGRWEQYGIIDHSGAGVDPLTILCGGEFVYVCDVSGAANELAWLSGVVDLSGCSDLFKNLQYSVFGPDLQVTRTPQLPVSGDFSLTVFDTRATYP